MAKETDAELLDRLGDDASKWADEFRNTAVSLGYSDMDEGWLIGWFANAIEHSSNVRRRHDEESVLALSDLLAAAKAFVKPFASQPERELKWTVTMHDDHCAKAILAFRAAIKKLEPSSTSTERE